MDQLLLNSSENLKNLEFFETFLLKNYKKCPIHPKKQLCSLIFDKNQGQHLRCIQCILNSKQNEQTIDLIDILESNEKTIFNLCSLHKDSFISQLQQISSRQSFFQDAQNNAKKYFQNLKQKVDQIIDYFEKQHMVLIEKAWQMNDQIIEVYNTSINKQELKDILLNKYENYEEQNQLLSTLINKVIDNKQEINSTLETSIEELNKILKKISDPNYSKIQKTIARNFEQIDLQGSNITLIDQEFLIHDSDEESEKKIHRGNRQQSRNQSQRNIYKDEDKNQDDNQGQNEDGNEEDYEDENQSENDDDNDDDDDEDDRFSFSSRSTNQSYQTTNQNSQRHINQNRRNNRNHNQNYQNNYDRRNYSTQNQVSISDLIPGEKGQSITGQVTELTEHSKQIGERTLYFLKGRIADDKANIRFDIKKPNYLNIEVGKCYIFTNINNKVGEDEFHFIDLTRKGKVQLSEKTFQSINDQRGVRGSDKSSIQYILKIR
ncbi:hypothetical protein ABPG74_022389 [Tetrahymena malaccensis]